MLKFGAKNLPKPEALPSKESVFLRATRSDTGRLVGEARSCCSEDSAEARRLPNSFIAARGLVEVKDPPSDVREASDPLPDIIELRVEKTELRAGEWES